MLFYTQCCDVNQPLHPLARAIPTLGEAQAPARDSGISSRAFPGAGWGRARGAAAVGMSCGSTSPSCQHLSLCPLGFCTQLFKFSLRKSVLVEHLIPVKHCKLSAPRTSCCHPSWTPLCRIPTAVTKLLLVQSACVSARAGKIHI